MGSQEKHQEVIFTTPNENMYTDAERNTRSQKNANEARKSRKRMIIAAVVLVATIIIATAVVVPVVVLHNKDSEAAKKDDGCGPYSYPGVNISQLTPRIISHIKTCPLQGDCWTGEQCFACFKLDNYKVGNINNIPVCCPRCERHGLHISNSRCHCSKRRTV